MCPVQQVCVLYSTGKVGVSSGKSVYLVAIYVCCLHVLWQSLCVLYSNSVCPVAKSVCPVQQLCVSCGKVCVSCGKSLCPVHQW